MLLSDCFDDGGGASDGGDSDDGRDGVDDGSDGDGRDGWLLGSEEGSLLGSDEGDGSDDGSLLGEDGLLLGDEGLLLGDDDGDDDGDDEGDDPLLLLDFGQQPSPKASTSHLSLSAKCLAMPYVPAGITVGPPELLPDSSGPMMPIESTTVNVKSTGQYMPSYKTSFAKAAPQRGSGSSNLNRQWSSYEARICQRHSWSFQKHQTQSFSPNLDGHRPVLVCNAITSSRSLGG